MKKNLLILILMMTSLIPFFENLEAKKEVKSAVKTQLTTNKTKLSDPLLQQTSKELKEYYTSLNKTLKAKAVHAEVEVRLASLK